MNKRDRRRYGEVIAGAIRDARAGDLLALEFLQVAAPDVLETLRLSSLQPHRKGTIARKRVRVTKTDLGGLKVAF